MPCSFAAPADASRLRPLLAALGKASGHRGSLRRAESRVKIAGGEPCPMTWSGMVSPGARVARSLCGQLIREYASKRLQRMRCCRLNAPVASIEQQERHWAENVLTKRSVCDPSTRRHSCDTTRQIVRGSFTLHSCNPDEDRDATLAPLPQPAIVAGRSRAFRRSPFLASSLDTHTEA